MSIAGEAFMTLPPIVPCARVACDPTMAEASARPVKCSRTTGWATSSRVGDERAEPQPAARPLDAAQGVDAVDADDAVRQRRLALAGADDEVGAAGDRARAAAELLDGLLDVAAATYVAAHRPSSCTALQTRSGVIGRCLTCRPTTLAMALPTAPEVGTARRLADALRALRARRSACRPAPSGS